MSRVRTKDAGGKRRKLSTSESTSDMQLKEAADLFVRVLKALHFTDQQIGTAISHACEKENPKRVPNVSTGSQLLGNVVRKWMEDPRFVGADGKPRVLSVRGNGATFATLIKETVPGGETKECLDEMIKTRAVALIGPSRVRCISSTTYFISPTVTYQKDVLEPVTELLRNVAWNLIDKMHNGKPGMFQRGITGVEISKEDFLELDRMLMQHGMGLLEVLDAWVVRRSLHPRTLPGKKKRDSYFPYIGLFLSPRKQMERPQIGSARKD